MSGCFLVQGQSHQVCSPPNSSPSLQNRTLKPVCFYILKLIYDKTSTSLVCLLESLRKGFAGSFWQEECGAGADDGAEAQDDGRKDGGHLPEVDDGGREEDGDASNYLTEGDTLATDDGGEDLAAVLKTDEESSISCHPPNQSHGEADKW